MISLKNRKTNIANAEIFTPPQVVSYMIAQAEATLGHIISIQDSILEPSAGNGAFVVPLLKKALQNSATLDWNQTELERFLTIYEVNSNHVSILEGSIIQALLDFNCPVERAQSLCNSWIHVEDFLLSNLTGKLFDIVIGNPPYIRYDAISRQDILKYPKIFQTFQGRCDLYVPFI